MKIARCLAVFAVAVLVTSCVRPPEPRNITRTFDYGESYEEVWSAVVETLAEMNVPLEKVQKESGLITVSWMNYLDTENDEYCDCGDVSVETKDGRFNVFVKDAEDKARVTVNAHYVSTYTSAGETIELECVSTGRLEREITDRVQAKLNPAPEPTPTPGN